MNPTDEQLQIASRLDAKVQRLLEEGKTDVDVFVEMAGDMPDFKRLLDAGQALMDALCLRFEGFYHYAKILEQIAAGHDEREVKNSGKRRPSADAS
jgi:hypothetical protein